VTLPEVHIHYRRPPDRVEVFVQELLHDDPAVKVTFQPATPIERPVDVGGRVILEPGSPVVWFTFPGAWHDIGRFHTTDGAFTGLYANVLTPPELGGDTPHRWETTDLFLDVWLAQGEAARILDRDQFDEARARGWIDDAIAERALAEAEALRAAHARGAWPPPIVEAWTLERARARRAAVSPGPPPPP
jgi:predicted RNA-binding protein associated with RNAse of E/G family